MNFKKYRLYHLNIRLSNLVIFYQYLTDTNQYVWETKIISKII